jgi:hypothetical protein
MRGVDLLPTHVPLYINGSQYFDLWAFEIFNTLFFSNILKLPLSKPSNILIVVNEINDLDGLQESRTLGVLSTPVVVTPERQTNEAWILSRVSLQSNVEDKIHTYGSLEVLVLFKLTLWFLHNTPMPEHAISQQVSL